jgi:hypothetical protein
MKRGRKLLCTLLSMPALLTVAGCALSPMQRQDVARWEAEAANLGHPDVKYEQVVDPETAVALSFLPFGVGGFYVHRPGMGVSGILCWPLSLTWAPAMAGPSARRYNVELLRKRVATLREEANSRQGTPVADSRSALDRIERLHQEGRISDAEYQDLRKRTLERMTMP